MNDRFKKTWGLPGALLQQSRRFAWIDLLVIVGLAGLIYGLINLAQEWEGELRPAVEISLSPTALPGYAFFSLARGLIAYLFSLGFTLVYGYWAAKDRAAERILIPLLDILQSIPVLGFMPGLVLALVGLFPKSNVGLELAAILMIFTGQVWNMTFSFYHSLRSVPDQLQEVGRLYGFNWWRRFKWIELPFSMMGLVWNSMMSMAGGWFFLMINEAFVLGGKDFRLPGLGSYMSVAVARGDLHAMIWAVITMIAMIVLLDQLLWRPVVVWAQKFRLEDTSGAESMSSWFLDWLHRSHLVRRLGTMMSRLIARPTRPASSPPAPVQPVAATSRLVGALSLAFFVLLLAGLSLGAWELVNLLRVMTAASWAIIVSAAGCTLGRVLLATAISTLWTLPAGLAIGLSPRLSRLLQPVVQVMASFPAPMLFPAVVAGLQWLGITLQWGCLLLMLLGTQWYLLFNIIAGAMAVPADLREAARSYGLRGWLQFWKFHLPAVFPYLVTGWVTAAGGTWNASIVSEYVNFKGHVLTAWGLGAQISLAAEKGDFPMLAASILVMSLVVVAFNQIVWKPCYRLAEKRFSLNK